MKEIEFLNLIVMKNKIMDYEKWEAEPNKKLCFQVYFGVTYIY